MSEYYKGKRTRNIYSPTDDKPFKLSRSKIDLFMECPRCFYIDRRLGLGRPPGFPFALNSAVDSMLKKEFDALRENGGSHPLLEQFGVDAKPAPIDTIMYLKERYEQEAESVRMFTIRGDDYLPQMLTWTDELSEHEGLYEFVIVPRLNPSLEGVSASPEQIDLVSRMSYLMTFQNPIEVSSSLVRDRLKQGIATETAIPVGAIDQINEQGLYGTNSEESKQY